jgi:SET domain-containing protein
MLEFSLFAAQPFSMKAETTPWHEVRESPLHGMGVFAARHIPAGTRISDYKGKRITPEQADAMFPVNPNDPYHTFFFSLSGGKIIDGGQGGNDARWINHSCEPNCETQENSAGTRVFVVALRDIVAGEELFYDYSLVIDDRITKTLKQNYRCLCGAASCRGTMLALPEKKKNKKDKAEKTEKAEKSGKRHKKKK